MQKNSILFLTPNNLATNPRLYKELQLALELGHQCTLIQFKLGNWSDLKTEELINRLIENLKAKSGHHLLNSKNHQIINLDATPKNKLNWFKWGILEKLAQKLYPIFQKSIKINALASSRRSLQLFEAGSRLKRKPDLICAHNLSALYAARKLSQKWDISFAFDVEDYHPGEMIRFAACHENQRREYLMKCFLPKATALTSASPLIGEYTLNLIGGHPNHQIILNSFPQVEFIPPLNHKGEKSINSESRSITQLINYSNNQPLKMVWFSQKISFGRGLEQLFEALNLFNAENTSYIENRTSKIQLTLIGEMDPEFEKQIISPFTSKINNHHSPIINQDSSIINQQSPIINHKSSIINHKSSIINLTILPPLSQPDLHAELANHDVGLALEFNSTDLNRQLCLTNKIMAYTQAGLYVLATDTPGQNQFMEAHPDSGMVCGQTIEGIMNGLKLIHDQNVDIAAKRMQRYERGKKLAWEQEREKLIAIWKNIWKK